jgi:hypothetical protein
MLAALAALAAAFLPWRWWSRFPPFKSSASAVEAVPVPGSEPPDIKPLAPERYKVSRDPGSIIAALTALTLATIAAAYVPAKRAASIDLRAARGVKNWIGRFRDYQYETHDEPVTCIRSQPNRRALNEDIPATEDSRTWPTAYRLLAVCASTFPEAITLQKERLVCD